MYSEECVGREKYQIVVTANRVVASDWMEGVVVVDVRREALGYRILTGVTTRHGRTVT